MSNSYTQFCERIPTETEEEQEFVIKRLSVNEEGDNYDYDSCADEPACDIEKDGLSVIVSHSDSGSGDADRVADVVFLWQKQFNKTEPWEMSFANTSDKKSIGHFGGGQVLCWRGEQLWTHQIGLKAELKKKMGW